MSTVYALFMLGAGDDENCWELVCIAATQELAQTQLERHVDEIAELHDDDEEVFVPEMKIEPIDFYS
jgi:hypothetical protein